MTGKGNHPDTHRVTAVALEQGRVRVLHQRGHGMLPHPGRGHREPAHPNQWSRARAVTQQAKRHMCGSEIAFYRLLNILPYVAVKYVGAQTYAHTPMHRQTYFHISLY